MGTYPPRECGIATFNQDLLLSSQKFLGDNVSCKVAALNISTIDTYIYPAEVEWKIDQNNVVEYMALANTFNEDPTISGIILQHEYGIYGGECGENILIFMEKCIKPILVTLHTVLPDPDPKMALVTNKIISRSNVIVVLTENSKKILEKVYPNAIGKVQVIPHGIHQTTFSTTVNARKKLKLHKNATILSTFGLLSRGKGIEYVIKALPALIKKHPNILYLVLGETHPIVRRNEGESYRKELSQLVSVLHLKKHVKFYDQYLSLKDLFQFLKATDIYMSSSINPDQAVSGTLSYALGAGRAVISTEFAQAKEIITKDSGRLVPLMDSDAYTRALVSLLKDKRKLKKMHKIAYVITRPMLWGHVASKYSELLSERILPTVKLDHLTQMTDGFGLFQFANLDKPDKKFGYTLDDNARALIALTWLTKPINKKVVGPLILKYLIFLENCQQKDGNFINYIDYPGKKFSLQNKNENLEDASARAIWALGEVIGSKNVSAKNKTAAENIFIKSLSSINKFTHLRSRALVIKASAIVLGHIPKYETKLNTTIKFEAEALIKEFKLNSVKDWKWFDSYLGYNNGVIPEALLIAWDVTGNSDYLVTGKSSLNFLINKTFSGSRYLPIGHSHWYENNEKRSSFDQQPEDPASMILALVTAHKITHDESYLNLITICFSWFMGNNSLQLPLYNSINGGCFDGLHPDRVNMNQGAESLVSYLLSRLAITHLPQYAHQGI